MRAKKYTSENELLVPLLEALLKKGGEGRTVEVYALIPDMVQLTYADLNYYRKGRSFPEYGITLDLVVGRLRRAGILEPPSGDARIKLTDAGYALMRAKRK